MNPFYRSRKFLWAVVTLLAAAVVQVLPDVFPQLQGIAAFQEYIGWIFLLGLGGLLGHTMTDIVALLQSGDKPLASLSEAAAMLIEAILNPNEDTAQVEAEVKAALVAKSPNAPQA